MCRALKQLKFVVLWQHCWTQIRQFSIWIVAFGAKPIKMYHRIDMNFIKHRTTFYQSRQCLWIFMMSGFACSIFIIDGKAIKFPAKGENLNDELHWHLTNVTRYSRANDRRDFASMVSVPIQQWKYFPSFESWVLLLHSRPKSSPVNLFAINFCGHKKVAPTHL